MNSTDDLGRPLVSRWLPLLPILLAAMVLLAASANAARSFLRRDRKP